MKPHDGAAAACLHFTSVSPEARPGGLLARSHTCHKRKKWDSPPCDAGGNTIAALNHAQVIAVCKHVLCCILVFFVKPVRCVSRATVVGVCVLWFVGCQCQFRGLSGVSAGQLLLVGTCCGLLSVGVSSEA